MKLRKIDAAEANLKFAVRLFFARAHPVAVETLNAAASGVLRGLGEKHGIQSYLHDSDLIRDEHRGEWISILHKAQNFFKHADKDSEAELDYDPKMLQFLILETCHLYRYLASEKYLRYHQLKEAICFEVWFSCKYPEYLRDRNWFRKIPGCAAIANADPEDYEVWKAAMMS
jgi:hypothetical protein